MNRTSKIPDPGLPGADPSRKREYIAISILILVGLSGLYYVQQSVSSSTSRANNILFARMIKAQNPASASHVVPVSNSRETAVSTPTVATNAEVMAGEFTQLQLLHLPVSNHSLVIDFGDGQSAPVKDLEISHRYQKEGVYNIRILDNQPEAQVELSRTSIVVEPLRMVTSGE